MIGLQIVRGARLQRWALGFLVLTLLGVVGRAEDQPAAVEDPAARDLGAVRKAVGGKLLDGTLFARPGDPNAPDDDNRLFIQQVQRLAKRSNSSLPEAVSPTVKDNVSVSMSETPRSRLRMAARRLELLAADLEDDDLYDEADRLRAMARNLRLRGRVEPAPSEPNIPLPILPDDLQPLPQP